jgi:hypothetical protein
VLKKLKQRQKSMAEYKTKFDEQSSLTKWSPIDLHTCFYDGLSDSIKDTLAITDCPVETLTDLFKSAQIVDMRMRQRATEKKGQTFHQQGKLQDPLGWSPWKLMLCVNNKANSMARPVTIPCVDCSYVFFYFMFHPFLPTSPAIPVHDPRG